MNTLSIWTFDTPDRAEAALAALERRQHRRLISIDDAAVVAWPTGRRRPQSYQAGTAVGTAALSGAFWGLLFAILFLLPLVGEPAGSAAARGEWLSRIGLPDELLARTRERVEPGTSALFLLTHDAVLDHLREAFSAMSPDLLVSTLDGTQEAALLRAFDSDDGATDRDTDPGR